MDALTLRAMDMATNVYRTDCYIVLQRLGICRNGADETIAMSVDSYYLRNPQRDALYERRFVNRRYKDGKRLRATMYSREYID